MIVLVFDITMLERIFKDSFCIDSCSSIIEIPTELEDSDITYVTFIFPTVSLKG